MSLGVRIDWLTLTKNKWPDAGSELVEGRAAALVWAHVSMERCGLLDPVLKAVPPSRFYSWAWIDEATGARVDIPEDVGVQGVKVTFSGTSFTMDGAAQAILRTALDQGFECSRIDIAVDLIEEGVFVGYVKDDWEKADMPRNLRYGWINSSSGSTFSIGSRQSERYLRIYDKGKEQKIGHQWTRFECEYKGGLARLVASEVSKDIRGALPDIQHSLRFCRREIKDKLEALSSMPASKIRSVGRVGSPKEAWFYGQVTQAFRAWASDDFDAAKGWASMMLHLLDEGI